MNESEADIRERLHEANIAKHMASTLTLLRYQTEAVHRPHLLQTKLVIALGQAQDAAVEFEKVLRETS